MTERDQLRCTDLMYYCLIWSNCEMVVIKCRYVCYRSLEKDFQLAQFSEENINWWRHFFQQPIKASSESWPTFKKTMSSPAHSSLSQRELELIEKYKEKRNVFKEVGRVSNGIGSKYVKSNIWLTKQYNMIANQLRHPHGHRCIRLADWVEVILTNKLKLPLWNNASL